MIISIYPMTLTLERPWGTAVGRYYTKYVIPAAPRDGYSFLEVEPAWQSVYYGEDIGYRWEMIPAEKVAADIVNSFTAHRLGSNTGATIGLFVPATGKPTKEELEKARNQQELYFSNLFAMAEEFWRTGQIRNISDEMRQAARWLNRQAPWVEPFTAVDMKECPFCASKIMAKAVVCPHCHKDVSK